ncbi:MAG: hypothetical protein PHT91_03230 [Candidatus Nanoarchaeia archaeon]|nr:hypothetical protein [Candidatus Nanoarchaeia archaeon]MDD5499861.1 hypothetical protein [Candidatus Nanoarchaeia archaeon]
MNIFKSKTNVEKAEKNFETKKMENKEVFHELNIKSQDPEVLRTQVVELLEAMDYGITINKFAKFDDSEFENIFQAGRLKPLRAVLHAHKKVQTGSKYPWLWKILILSGLILMIAFMVPQNYLSFMEISFNNNIFMAISSILLFSGMLLWFLRKFDTINIWFKSSGIYNVEEKNSDFKIILSGESTGKALKKKLDNDITQIFSAISAKYVKNKVAPEKSLLELPKNSKNLDVRIIRKINDLENDSKNLDSRLANNDISEKTYLELKEEFTNEKQKLETILDLIN